MTAPESRSLVERVVSPREARLIFWLVIIALVTLIANGAAGYFSALATPAVILFVAWLMAYVLEPPVSWLQRKLRLKGRGLSVAITYLVTSVVTFVVLAGAGLALLSAAITFVEQLPTIVARLREIFEPIVAGLGLDTPEVDLVATLRQFLAESGDEITAVVTSVVSNLVFLVGALLTAVIISVGLAVGQVSLLGWLRVFLPSSTYRDLTELEAAIAKSFGGFVRGRLLIGAIFGLIVTVAAFIFGVPFGPLIGVIAGLIVFIPWIGPLLGWAVLPAFALVLAPDVVVPCLVVSLLAAIAVQLIVTQLVMGAAVNMSPVAVFVVVFLGTSLAGIAGAVFAIPVAAAILSITDYLRQRDVLLRMDTNDAETTIDGATGAAEPDAAIDAAGRVPAIEPLATDPSA